MFLPNEILWEHKFHAIQNVVFDGKNKKQVVRNIVYKHHGWYIVGISESPVC